MEKFKSKRCGPVRPPPPPPFLYPRLWCVVYQQHMCTKVIPYKLLRIAVTLKVWYDWVDRTRLSTLALHAFFIQAVCIPLVRTLRKNVKRH